MHPRGAGRGEPSSKGSPLAEVRAFCMCTMQRAVLVLGKAHRTWNEVAEDTVAEANCMAGGSFSYGSTMDRMERRLTGETLSRTQGILLQRDHEGSLAQTRDTALSADCCIII